MAIPAAFADAAQYTDAIIGAKLVQSGIDTTKPGNVLYEVDLDTAIVGTYDGKTGGFVATAQGVRFWLYDATKTAQIPSNKDSKIKITANKLTSYVTGFALITIGADANIAGGTTDATNAGTQQLYYFDKQGYLQTGDSKGRLVYKDSNNEYVQVIIGVETWGDTEATPEGTITNYPKAKLFKNNQDKVTDNRVPNPIKPEVLKYDVKVNPSAYAVAKGTPSVGYKYENAVYFTDGSTSESVANPSGFALKAVQTQDNVVNPQMNTGWNMLKFYQEYKSGVIEMCGKVMPIPAQYDKLGNETYPATARVYNHDGWAVTGDETYATPTKGYVVKTDNKMYLIDDDDDAIIEGYAGDPIASVKESTEETYFYLLKDDGSLYVNENKPSNQHTATQNAYMTNLYQLSNGKIIDGGTEVTLNIGGYDQNYYISPSSKYGADITISDYRYRVAADGKTLLGITYYGAYGVSNKGWVAAGTDNALVYQTSMPDPDNAGKDLYYIVTRLQQLDACQSPEDADETIKAGFYLFDDLGEVVMTSCTMFGHEFEMDKEGAVVKVDGHDVSYADVIEVGGYTA